MPTGENNPAFECPSNLMSAFGAGVRSSTRALPLTANSSQSGKRRRHCLGLPEDHNPRAKKNYIPRTAFVTLKWLPTYQLLCVGPPVLLLIPY